MTLNRDDQKSKETEVVRNRKDQVIFQLLPDGSFPRPKELVLNRYAASSLLPLLNSDWCVQSHCSHVSRDGWKAELSGSYDPSVGIGT